MCLSHVHPIFTFTDQLLDARIITTKYINWFAVILTVHLSLALAELMILVP